MPSRPGASPRQGRCRTGRAFGFLRCLCVLATVLVGVTTAGAETPETPETPRTPRTVVVVGDSAHAHPDRRLPREITDRDSLMVEIRNYTELIESMRDSLTSRDLGINLSDEQKEMIRGKIDEISLVVEQIAGEVSELEFEIKDNTISFLNDSGEGIIINIPENLDESLSEGFHVLSEMILNEIPDSLDFDAGQGWDWTNFIPEAPPPPRKAVHGNIVKVWDDLHIPASDDVRGHVVLAFGNAEISGRVEGNVVALFGNLLLDDSAEVTGKIVSIGGGLDQDPEAEVGDVVSIDLRGGGWGLPGFVESGPITFLVLQGMFLLTVMLAVIAVALLPRERFANVTDNLRRAPLPSLGLGTVTATLGFVVGNVLIAILVATIIGAPLGLLIFLALLLALVLAVGASGAAIGAGLCGRLGQDCRQPWLATAVGMTILHLVSFLGALAGLFGADALAQPLMILGVTIKVLAFLMGLGAILVSRLGSRAAS